MTDRLSLSDDNDPRTPREQPERAMRRAIRDYEDKRDSVPSLEDILNDPDLDADDTFEPCLRTDDFLAAPDRLAEPAFPHEKAKAKRADIRKQKFTRRIATTDEERKWATIAHASGVLTFILGLASAGTLSLFTLMVPLAIYLHWRHKSEYVAFQALQAFALQVLGTIGWLTLVVGGSIAFAIVTVGLVISIVGALLLIVLVPLFVLLLLASFAIPIGMVIYSVIAALQTNQGADYRLPRIGRWIDRQLHSGLLGDN